MTALLLGRRRYRGRRRAGAVRDWPLAWRAAVDPWEGAPLFCVDLERQRIAVAAGRRKGL